MKKILVTGSSGYIGRVLVPHLRGAGHWVEGLDAGWYGLALGDRLGDFSTMTPAQLASYDAVIHLAWYSSAGPGLDKVHDMCAHQSVAFAGQCIKAGVEVFAFASSASVYGETGVLGREDMDPEPSKACPYSVAKLAAEKEIRFGAQGQMRVVALRKATLFGDSPRLRLDLCINAFVDAAANYGQIRIWGGQKSRPILEVRDAVRFYQMAVERDELDGVINCGWKSSTIRNWAEAVCASLLRNKGYKIGIHENEPTNDVSDVRSYQLDQTKANALGFTANYDITSTIIDGYLWDHVKSLTPTDRVRALNRPCLEFRNESYWAVSVPSTG